MFRIRTCSELLLLLAYCITATIALGSPGHFVNLRKSERCKGGQFHNILHCAFELERRICGLPFFFADIRLLGQASLLVSYAGTRENVNCIQRKCMISPGIS